MGQSRQRHARQNVTDHAFPAMSKKIRCSNQAKVIPFAKKSRPPSRGDAGEHNNMRPIMSLHGDTYVAEKYQ